MGEWRDARGRGSSASNIGANFYLCIHLLTHCRTTKFDVLTLSHVGGGACILGSAIPSTPRERSPSAPQFWGFPVFIPTSFNAEQPNIRHGNTYGEGRILGSQPRHFVARFVSRSCFLFGNKKMWRCSQTRCPSYLYSPTIVISFWDYSFFQF